MKQKQKCSTCKFWKEYGTMEVTKNSLNRTPYRIGDCYANPDVVFNKAEHDICRLFEK